MRPPSTEGWGERVVPPAEGRSRFAQMRAIVNGIETPSLGQKPSEKRSTEKKPVSFADAYARWQERQED